MLKTNANNKKEIAMDYLVIDKGTGNYVDESSVKDSDEGLKIISYTGRTSGLEFYSTKERAEQAVKKIQKDLKRFGLHREMAIIETLVEELVAGDCIIVTIKS